MRYEIWGLVGPLSWPLWSLVLAMIARLCRHRRTSAVCLGGALILQLVIGMPVVVRLLMAPLENHYPMPVISTLPTHLVVLAGAEKLRQSKIQDRPTLTDASERLSEAVVLASRFPDAQIILVGGVRWRGLRDIDVGVKYMREMGVAPQRIRWIDNTTDTCTNAAGVARLKLQAAELVLITSAMHMPRAMACFTQAGLQPVPYPVDFRSSGTITDGPWFAPGSATTYSNLDFAAHEWTGLIWYRLSGRTHSVLP
jgi:uncharacterized SAM-binding protein YcdF (DUF218 family)